MKTSRDFDDSASSCLDYSFNLIFASLEINAIITNSDIKIYPFLTIWTASQMIAIHGWVCDILPSYSEGPGFWTQPTYKL
jgi:hypothetical protein